MAKMMVKPPDDLIRSFERAGSEMDGIAEAALRVGADIMRREGAEELLAALSMPRKYPKRGTGELLSRLGVSGMQISSKGVYDVSVGFREPRKAQRPVRDFHLHRHTSHGRTTFYTTLVANRGYYVATNAMVANILEHGHRGAHGGQAPTGFWVKAMRKSRPDVINAMEDEMSRQLKLIFNKE